MGQRTQLVVEVTKIVEDSDKKKTKKTYVGSYHNQWGIGKMQLFDVIRFVTTYRDNYSKDNYVMPETLGKAYLLNGKEYEHPFKGKATPQKVIEWLNTQDNNDGGILLKLKVDYFDQIQCGELYIFNDPEMDYSKSNGKSEYRVNRQISLLEYINYMPEYFNEPFITAFTALMRFYNIQIMEPKQGEK